MLYSVNYMFHVSNTTVWANKQEVKDGEKQMVGTYLYTTMVHKSNREGMIICRWNLDKEGKTIWTRFIWLKIQSFRKCVHCCHLVLKMTVLH